MKKPTKAEVKKARLNISMGDKIFNPEFNAVVRTGYRNIEICDEADRILKEMDKVIEGRELAPCILASAYLVSHLVALSPDKWNKVLDKPTDDKIKQYIG